ncbi:hypothetical protein B0T20DRAFT_354407 [Sordaria brevicollis]|uniref:Uncharacterized protein n=1 Tax=Sordaria brevicollis TaxID=83679 RepID=A0AAE0UB13_SORBR|nr:hypothetical protein B0T20DRAFT_354407 [Sordaria brevicollis]
MSANPDSVTNQGQFHSSVPPAEPRTRFGVSQQVGNEAAPEFRAKTFAPGTAPEKDSHHANPIHATPGQALNPDVDPSSRTGALDAFPGSTSQSVHNQTEYGRPMQGQTSNELHGMKVRHRKKERSGLEGVGATDKHAETVENKVRQQVADKPEGIERGIRGIKDNTGEGGYNALGAEHSQPETAQRVATENP